MKVFVNEKEFIVKEDTYISHIKKEFKKDADVVILNGAPIKEDIEITEGDEITLIKKGEIPNRNELQSLLIARHTPGVFKKCRHAVVGVGGLGGLGSNIAISLARVGVGKLILVDYDVVEPSNLNRQQYFIKHIGMYKTEALKELINEINPFIDIETRTIFLDKSNIEECFKEADVIVEAFDEPKCKAELVNTVLNKLPNKPIVAASGMAGYFSNNIIKTKRVMKNLYISGDEVSEARVGCGLMAPRVGIAANHQANMVLRIILGEEDV